MYLLNAPKSKRLWALCVCVNSNYILLVFPMSDYSHRNQHPQLNMYIKRVPKYRREMTIYD